MSTVYMSDIKEAYEEYKRFVDSYSGDSTKNDEEISWDNFI